MRFPRSRLQGTPGKAGFEPASFTCSCMHELPTTPPSDGSTVELSNPTSVSVDLFGAKVISPTSHLCICAGELYEYRTSMSPTPVKT